MANVHNNTSVLHFGDHTGRSRIIKENIPYSVLRIVALAGLVLACYGIAHFHGGFASDFHNLLHKNLTWQQGLDLFGPTAGLVLATGILAQQTLSRASRRKLAADRPKENLSQDDVNLLELERHSTTSLNRFRLVEGRIQKRWFFQRNANEMELNDLMKTIKTNRGKANKVIAARFACLENDPLRKVSVSETTHIPEFSEVKPIYNNGKWLYSENQPNHGIEAAKIGIVTQAKRLARFFFPFFRTLQYITKEDKDNIYQFDETKPYDEGLVLQNVRHACVLFQHKGLNILTDPALNDLNPWIYPGMTESGVTMTNLPPPDVVLISHNHRDHVDAAAMKALQKFDPIMLVPEGDADRFRRWGFTQVHEHKWWSTTEVTLKKNREKKTFQFHALPSYHWSGRGPFDAQRSQTVSWAFNIKGNAENEVVYFAGDSAKMKPIVMSEMLRYVDYINTEAKKEMGEDVGESSKVERFHFNSQPAGPNKPNSLMRSTHKTALDSAITHEELHSELTILMHHNAFELGTDEFDEASRVLREVLEETPRSSGYAFIDKIRERTLAQGERGQEIWSAVMKAIGDGKILAPRIGQRIVLREAE